MGVLTMRPPRCDRLVCGVIIYHSVCVAVRESVARGWQ